MDGMGWVECSFLGLLSGYVTFQHLKAVSFLPKLFNLKTTGKTIAVGSIEVV